ncbi:O-antigen ligase family protein [Limnohabitans sp.]|uniref:O-antigen ligase family protein n=1 Tax=Limnohabitans sp. TaxID=1907725 RepID=UPI00286F50AB|nr:O-antigen ligase family protein [Limnohabitans sp.]
MADGMSNLVKRSFDVDRAGLGPLPPATYAILFALIGPALGYGGIYVSHFCIIIYFGWLLLLPRSIESTVLSSSAMGEILLGATILLYCLLSLGWSQDPAPVLMNFMMLLLSFATFSMAAITTSRTLLLSESIRALKIYFLILTAACAVEMLSGWRFPISRYSSFQGNLDNIDIAPMLLNVPTAFYGNQNNLALMCVCAIPLAALFANSAFRYFVVGSVSFIIVMSGSRIAFAVLILQWLILLVARAKKYLVLLGVAAFAIYLSMSAVLADMPVCGEYLPDRVCIVTNVIAENLELNELAAGSDSIGVRVSLSLQIWNLWIARPWFGVGPGRLESLISAEHFQAGAITNPHNPPLEILAEYGIVGALPWISAWLLMLRALSNIPDQRLRRNFVLIGLMAPIASITVSSVYFFTAFWALMGVVLGLARRLIIPKASERPL